MAEIILNLSGENGLANLFAGDADQITPQPQNRINAQEAQMASGTFNPLLRKGYLSPSITTTTSVSLSDAVTKEFSSYSINNTLTTEYIGNRSGLVYSRNAFSNDTFSLFHDFNDTGVSKSEVHDLQSYLVNNANAQFITGVLEYEHDADINTQIDVRIVKNLGGSRPVGSIRNQFLIEPATGSTDSPRPVFHTKTTLVDQDRGSLTMKTPAGRGNLFAIITAWDYAPTSPGAATWDSGIDVVSNGSFSQLAGGSYNASWGGHNLRQRDYFLYNLEPEFEYNITVYTDSKNAVNGVVFLTVFDNVLQGEYPMNYIESESSTSTNSWSIFQEDPSSVGQTLFGMLMTKQVSSNNTGHSTLAKRQTLVGTHETTNASITDRLVTSLWSLNKSDTELMLKVITEDSGGGIKDFWEVNRETALRSDTDYNFLRNADNGFTYLFSDNTVHKIDGTQTGGTFPSITKNVILLPKYFRIVDAVDYRSNMYIAIKQYPVDISTTSLNTFSGSCGILVWNRISTQFNNISYIEIPGVREIKRIYASPSGMLKMICIGNNGLTEVRRFGYNDSGGVVFPVSKLLGLGAHPQYPDGLTTIGERVAWLANDGSIYVEEDFLAGQMESKVFKLFQAKAPGVTSDTIANNIKSGILAYASGVETADNGFRSNKQRLTMSYLDETTHVFQKIYPFDLKTGANGDQSVSQGDVYSGVQYIPVTSNVRNLRIYNLPITGSGTDTIATVKVYFNQSTNPVQPSGMTKSVSKNEARRGYVDFKINSHNIHSIQIEVEWSTSEALGPDTYHPSVAVIDYEASSTQSPDND
jgi:hypothetical protein